MPAKWRFESFFRFNHCRGTYTENPNTRVVRNLTSNPTCSSWSWTNHIWETSFFSVEKHPRINSTYSKGTAIKCFARIALKTFREYFTRMRLFLASNGSLSVMKTYHSWRLQSSKNSIQSSTSALAIAEQLYSWVDIRVSDFQPTIMSRLMVED